MLLIINKGTKAIISKLTNKAKVYEQCFDMLFQIKQRLIYKRNLDFCENSHWNTISAKLGCIHTHF